MRTIDFSPLFRHSVGFDRMQNLVDTATRLDTGDSAYPPYNIESHGENDYRITMAVAGFDANDIDVTVKENTVVITGKSAADDDKTEFLHRGIGKRGFERRFQLADTIKVVGGSLDNGLLHVDLVREVPEEQKPRRIEIATESKSHSIESKKAA
jgi:molecular chaperone IbpA